MEQITDTILMIRPVDYRLNEQTAVNNFFQKELALEPGDVTKRAQDEFDEFVKKLRKTGVRVIVTDDLKDNETPDSIFPNNWVSFHQNGTIVLYPMFAENRRKERREDVLTKVEASGFKIESILDYSRAEKDGKFLEGTGSLILDRINKKAYCALSPRADEDLVVEFCEEFEYAPVIFRAYQSVDDERKLIYHTNVMMGLAEDFALICLDSIDDKHERKAVAQSLKDDGKEIVELTEEQLNHFAGNVLQVRGTSQKKYLILSDEARQALTEKQMGQIRDHCEILSSDLTVIETLGGGSARCMMAEVFLPKV